MLGRPFDLRFLESLTMFFVAPLGEIDVHQHPETALEVLAGCPPIHAAGRGNGVGVVAVIGLDGLLCCTGMPAGSSAAAKQPGRSGKVRPKALSLSLWT